MLNVLSLNVKGLNIPEKRRMLLQDLYRMKSDVAFIQETHFKEGKLPILKFKFFPVVYHSTNESTKTCGVSIMISSRVPWTCLDVKSDSGGWYLFVRGTIGGTEVTLASIYVPNTHQDFFITKTLDLLVEFIN